MFITEKNMPTHILNNYYDMNAALQPHNTWTFEHNMIKLEGKESKNVNKNGDQLYTYIKKYIYKKVNK